MLNALPQVSINGPDVRECKPLITVTAKEWLAKRRRKIAKVPTKDIQQPVKLQDASVQVDTRSEDIARAWRVAEVLDHQVNFLERSVVNKGR